MNNAYFRYLNQKCPICGGSFAENDDIVVCPLCGTPHHRDCYNKNGECGNTDRHNEGYRWEPEATEQANPAGKAQTQTEPTNQPPNGHQQPFGNQQSPFGNQQPPYGQIQYAPPANPFSLFPSELEDGVATEEAATFVQMNAFRYIERFFHRKRNKKTWNWAAFFFTPYWFFYRKLHKIGAIFLAATLIISVFFTLLPPSVKFTEDFTEAYDSYLSDDSPEAEDKYLTEVKQVIKDNKAGIALSAVQFAIMLAIRIVSALYADKWYYDSTVKRVREIKDETPDPAQQKLLLFKKGGVSVGVPILAVMASSCVSMAISLIFQI